MSGIFNLRKNVEPEKDLFVLVTGKTMKATWLIMYRRKKSSHEPSVELSENTVQGIMLDLDV